MTRKAARRMLLLVGLVALLAKCSDAAILAPQGAQTASLEAALTEGGPTAPLGLGCRAALASMFNSTDCTARDVVECTTQSAVIFQWRLLCMSRVVKGPFNDLVGPVGAHGAYVRWSKVHPAASTYLDLWTTPVEAAARFGPVAEGVLRRQSETKLMLLELAQAPHVEPQLQAVFRQLAMRMGFKPQALLQAVPAARRVAASSLAGGPPQRGSSVRLQQNSSPFTIITLPIVGSHPLQNFARFQTVYVGTTTTPGQYRFVTPDFNSIAINTSDSEWLAAFTAASGYTAESSDFKTVYDASSAADTATTKGEASFNGYSVSVSAEFSKTESSTSSDGGIYMEWFTKKIYEPDPSNLKELGMPLADELKGELKEAVQNNRMDDFYKKWGTHVVYGFTRVVRFSSKLSLRMTSTTQADEFSGKASGSYEGAAMSVSATVEFSKQSSSSFSGVTMTVNRDLLPIGYQDADALEFAKACKLPDPILSLDELTADWATGATADLVGCSKGVGTPTATQGDRTHAKLVPIAYLSEFQQTVYEAQLEAKTAPLAPFPSSLLADLARLGAEPELIIRIQQVWGRAKQLQRDAIPFVGQEKLVNLTSVYGEAGRILREDLVTEIQSALDDPTKCDSSSCEQLITGINSVEAELIDLETNFKADLPFLRDGLQVISNTATLKSDSKRKLTPGTLPRQRIDNEVERIRSLAEYLTKQGSGGLNSSVTTWDGTDFSGDKLFNRTFTDTFVTAIYNNTDDANTTCGSARVGSGARAGAGESRVITRADNKVVNRATEGPTCVLGLKNTSSIEVGPGIIVTLFQVVEPTPAKNDTVPPPPPFWWPIFWPAYEDYWKSLYPVKENKPLPEPRTFLAEGTYADLDVYLQSIANNVSAIRVDRLADMTGLRKAAIMARLKEDLAAAQTLLDNTPGDSARR